MLRLVQVSNAQYGPPSMSPSHGPTALLPLNAEKLVLAATVGLNFFSSLLT